MKAVPTPADTLYRCFEYSQNQVSLLVKNAQIDTPGADMEAMNHAQMLRNKPHGIFPQYKM